MYFEGNDDQNGRTIWSCFTSPSHPLKKARPTFKPDCVIQLNCRRVRANASCETTSNIGELRPPKSIKNFSPFRRTMAGYLLCIYIYIYIYIYILYIIYYVYTSTNTHMKLCVHWVKNYGINGKEVPTEDWEELMYAYKATSRSTSAPKYKLINCLHLSGCLHLSKYLGAIPN